MLLWRSRGQRGQESPFTQRLHKTFMMGPTQSDYAESPRSVSAHANRRRFKSSGAGTQTDQAGASRPPPRVGPRTLARRPAPNWASSEEFEVNDGAQNGELHHDDDGQQQLVGHQPATEGGPVGTLAPLTPLQANLAKNKTNVRPPRATYRRDRERRIFLLRLRFSPVFTNYEKKRKSMRKSVSS